MNVDSVNDLMARARSACRSGVGCDDMNVVTARRERSCEVIRTDSTVFLRRLEILMQINDLHVLERLDVAAGNDVASIENGHVRRGQGFEIDIGMICQHDDEIRTILGIR